MRAVEVLQFDRGASRDLSDSFCENLVVIELDGTALRDELRGDWELEEVLKLDIAASIEETRRGVVDGTNSPEGQREDDRMGANAARSQKSRE